MGRTMKAFLPQPSGSFPAAGLFLLAILAVLQLSGCASSPEESQEIRIGLGTPAREIEKLGGKSVVVFSYRMNGHKYDFVSYTFSRAGLTTGVFEDGRLFADIPSTVWNDGLRRRLEFALPGEQSNIEANLRSIHALIVEQRRLMAPQGRLPVNTSAHAAGMVAFAALFGWYAPDVFSTTITQGARDRKAVDLTLLYSGVSYSAFLGGLPKPDQVIFPGPSYRVALYMGPGLASSDKIYVIGTLNGRVLWVAHGSSIVLSSFLSAQGKR